MKHHPLVRLRYPLLIVTVVAALAALAAIPHVNINADMTKYLPDDSPMRGGMQVMEREFGQFSAQAGEAALYVMYHDITPETEDSVLHVITGTKGVLTASTQHKENYVLYSVRALDDVDHVELADEMREQLPGADTVECPQESASADTSMLVIVVVVILVILLLMCRSWFEPLLFILSTGLAVLLNLGTNIFLDSVSATTFSIAAVLQFVLSMDYSLILSNRFRQEKAFHLSVADAMHSALVKSARSIVSSAATTIVGLLMLVFMNMKIGADLGIVLSKGVLCSLICNYTVLPALLTLSSRIIDRTRKPTPTIRTQALSRIVVKAKIPLAILFVVLAVGAFFGRNNTSISFCASQESEVSRVFPSPNISVIVYNNEDETLLPALADTMMQDSAVEMFVSYPSLLQRQYSYPQMEAAINQMVAMADQTVGAEQLPMLTDEMLRLVYYARFGADSSACYSFPELFTFLGREAHDTTSLVYSRIDAPMRAQLDMLDLLLDQTAEPQPKPAVHHHKAPVKAEPNAESKPVAEAKPDTVASQQPDTIAPKPKAKPKNKFADRELITRELRYDEMAAFLGFDESQAKMIYKMSKHQGGTMTPYNFVHYVADKLFKQAFVSTFVKKSEKEGLYKVRDTMDLAMSEPEEQPEAEAKPEVAQTGPSAEASQTDTVAVPRVVAERVAEAEQEKEPQLSFAAMAALTELLDTNNRFTAQELERRISGFGIKLDRSMIGLLYMFYGSQRHYDLSWTLSVEQMVDFIADSVIVDSRFDGFIPDSVKADFATMRESMTKGLAMMRGPEHSMAIIRFNYPQESPETYAFIDKMQATVDRQLPHDHYIMGGSNMFNEMRHGFPSELMLVTLLTILAIFLIVAISFRSIVIPLLLVTIIMTAVYIDVSFTGLGGNSILYIAYLIVQSILMGATIDYGILFTNSYREKRATMPVLESVQGAYIHSMNTITTSGLIMIVAPIVITFAISDPLVCPILKSISIGALASVVLIIFVLPALLVLTDKIIVRRKK